MSIPLAGTVALVGTNNQWIVLGKETVTFFHGKQATHYHAGDEVLLQKKALSN